MSVGPGELFSLASAFAWAVAVILFKQSGETFSATALNVYKNGLSTLLLLPTALLAHGLAPPRLLPGEWLLTIVSGIIGIAVADTLYLQALRTIGAGRTGIAATLYSPSVVALSYLFLGERLAPAQLAGFVLVLAAVVLISYRADARELPPGALRAGLPLGIGAVVLMAAGVVMVKPVIETAPFVWIVLIRVLAGLLGQLAVAAIRNRIGLLREEFRREHRWGRVTLASVLGTYVAMMLWLAGYRFTQASIASVLNETASVFIVLLAWRFLGEGLDARRACGVALSFLGVLLLVLPPG